MAATSRENRRRLTEVELQKEAENLWENEGENEIVDDMFGGEDSDEDYVEEQLSDSNSDQSENEDEVLDEPVRNVHILSGWEVCGGWQKGWGGDRSGDSIVEGKVI